MQTDSIPQTKLQLPVSAAGSLTKISQGLQELAIPMSVSFDGTEFNVMIGDVAVSNARLPIAVQMAVNKINEVK